MPAQSKKGVILMNLGSPDSTAVRDVRKYLTEFLMDERVIDTPYISRLLLVKGIISPFRAPKSAHAYRSVWTENGSPLIHITRQQRDALAQIIPWPVGISMRYGNPTMKYAYEELLAAHPGLEEVVLLPLYPHYAMSSYETAVAHAEQVHQQGKYPFRITVVPPFYNHPAYIQAQADSMRPYLSGLDDTHILFSYHSIPERHIHKSDITGSHCLKSGCCETDSPAHQFCYKHQCLVTTRLVAENLGLSSDRYSISFQSKLGRAEWLKPATTARMEQMPAEGIKKIAVVCPAFVADCLETLEEVAMRERENFLQAGGESYTFIPCMNTHPSWIKAMANLVNG